MRNMGRSGKEEGFLIVTITLNGCSGKTKKKPKRNHMNIHHLVLLNLFKL